MGKRSRNARTNFKGHRRQLSSIAVAGAFSIGLAVAGPTARSAAPSAAATSAARVRRPAPATSTAPAAGLGIIDGDGHYCCDQRSPEETALHGSFVPSLPVWGFTLPLVVQLSCFVPFGLVAWLGAT